jgi:phage-related protein
MQYFQTIYLKEAEIFVNSLPPKAFDKLRENVKYAERWNDPAVKKLRDEIWEFRTRYRTLQIRLLAFWDKTDNQKTLVIATHGFIKKTNKTPGNEIERAKNIRKKYFESKD